MMHHPDCQAAERISHGCWCLLDGTLLQYVHVRKRHCSCLPHLGSSVTLRRPSLLELQLCSQAQSNWRCRLEAGCDKRLEARGWLPLVAFGKLGIDLNEVVAVVTLLLLLVPAQ